MGLLVPEFAKKLEKTNVIVVHTKAKTSNMEWYQYNKLQMNKKVGGVTYLGPMYSH